LYTAKNRKEEGMRHPHVLTATRVTNAGVSFGGFLGIGDRLLAVPWNSMQIDANNPRFVLDAPKNKLENAPGFDENGWPDFADRFFGRGIYEYYRTPTYW
jgi:hypothetical protein